MIRPSILIAALSSLALAENLLNTVDHSRDLRDAYVAFDDQIKGCYKTCEPVTEYLDVETCTCVANTGQNGDDGMISNREDTDLNDASHLFDQEVGAIGFCKA